MNSSSFPSISNQYEGRMVQQWPNNFTIYDGSNRRYPGSLATIDSEEEQEHSRLDPESVPYVIVVQGPPNVGKSLLIKSLVKIFTKQDLDIRGPITVVAGKCRRIQFVECPNDVNGMIDAAKYADSVVFCIDASYGFEMETFEFFNLLQVHGFPNVVGVFSHLDKIKVALTETKHRLSLQFWNEIYDRAALYYLSRPDNGRYVDDQIQELAEFISVMEFNPLSWRTAHPYVLVDHFEDVTSPERVHIDKKCDRNIVMYGYLRGSNMKRGTKVHIAGVGDFHLYGITSLVDPCSLPTAAKRKGVSHKERLFYAPMSGLGDLLYDKDVEYMNKLNNLDGVTRLEIEDFRKGTYLKFEVRDVPFEMTKNIDSYCPILVGGISLKEENVGYMQARIKRHSWHRKSSKTRDPIIVSVGWRRYQIRPIYAQEVGWRRLHRIHCIPDHEDCLAMFWGPLAPPDTGIVAVYKGNKAVFRISATGVILDFTQAAEIVAKIAKKRKQVRTPLKIFEETALTKDMFTLDLEIDWLEGAAVQTARGAQGNVKKAAQEKLVIKLIRKGDQPKEGIASCSLQHEISLSDKVFMRVWDQVGELKDSRDCIEQGMETVGELKDSRDCIGQGMETVGELNDSLDKDDPARRQSTIEHRRSVVFSESRVRFGRVPLICEECRVGLKSNQIVL
ncbi:ribosome biogenesis protein BMS1 homolog isoform X1 [Papaver somniferum]|uniref:ribosome biogenesis protein BMS1 homolog isoform X1 n=1 Tax=Papaver somniferum TaxID=3469 RepID=UPI000E6F8C38|nr:ribosome biogenesis protein BMS1 homolog isoform X1 [Papaver somniferum]